MTIKQFLRQIALLLLLSFSIQSGFSQPLLTHALRVQNPAQTGVAVGLEESLHAGAEEKPANPDEPVPPKELTIRTGDLQIPVGPNTKITIEAGRVTLVPMGTPLPQESSPPPLLSEPPRALPAPPAVVPPADPSTSSGRADRGQTVFPDQKTVRGEPVAEPSLAPVIPEIINRGSISSARPAPSYSPTRPFKRLLWVAAASFLFITGVTIFLVSNSGKSWREIFSPSGTQIVPEQIESNINPPEQLDFAPEESAAVFPEQETFSGDQKVIQAASAQAGEAAHPQKAELSPTEFEQQFYQYQIALLQGLADAQTPQQPDGQGIFGRLRIASVPGEDIGRNRIKAELAKSQSEVDQAAAAVITVLQQEQFTKTASRSSRREIASATWTQYQQALNGWFDAQQRQLKRLVGVLAGFVEKDRRLLPGVNISLRDYYLDLTAHRLAEISAEEFEESRRLYGLMVRLGVELPFTALELPEGVGYGPSMVPAAPVPPDQLAPADERPEVLQQALTSMRALLAARAQRIGAQLGFLDWEIRVYREIIRKDPRSKTAEYDRSNVELKITSRLSLTAQRRRILAQEDYLAVTGSLLQDKGKTNLDLFEKAESRLRDAEKMELYERVFFYTGGTRDAAWRDPASDKRVSGSYAFTGGIAYLEGEVRREQRKHEQFHRGDGVPPQFELRLARQRRLLALLEYEQAVSDFSTAGLRRILGMPTGAGSAGLTRSTPLVREPQTVVLFPDLGDLGEVSDGLDLSDRMLTAAERQALTVFGLAQDLPEPARKKAAATAVAQSQKAAAIAVRALWQQRVWTAQEADIVRRLAQSELEIVSDNYLDAVYQEESNSVRIFEMRRLTAQLLMEGPLTLDQLLDFLKIPASRRESPAYLNRWFVFSNDADLLDFLGINQWDIKAPVGASDPARYRRLRERHDESVQLAIVARRFVNQNRIDAKRQQAEVFAKHKISTGWDTEKNSAEIAARQWMVNSMTELLNNNNREMAQGMPLFPGNRPAASSVPSVEDLAGLASRGIPQTPGYGGSVILDGARVPLTGGSYRESMVATRSGLPLPLPEYQPREHPLAGQRWVPPEQLQPVIVHDSSDPVTAAPSETVFAVRQGPPGSPFLDNGPYTFVNPGLLPVADAPIRIAGFIQPPAPNDPAAERKVLIYLPVRQMRMVDGQPELRVIGLLSREVPYSRISSEMEDRLDPQDERSLRGVFSSTPRGDLGTVHRVGDLLRAENGDPLRFLIGSRPFWLKIGIVSYPEDGKPAEEIRFERVPAVGSVPPETTTAPPVFPGKKRSGLEESLVQQLAEIPGFQAVVISAETAARYPQLAGAEERTYQWGNLQLVVLSDDPKKWSATIAGWLSQPTLNLTLYGKPGDASLSALRSMLAGAEESITVQGPYLPVGRDFSVLFKMILANMAGMEESAVSDADLNQAAELLGLGKYV